MTAKDKYNKLIDMIETKVEDPYQRTNDIEKSVIKESALSVRELNGLIQFMTGQTVKEYIKRRKIMAAYKFLLNEESINIKRAIDFSGLDNDSSFDKKFKSVFKCTPSEAYMKKDWSLYENPAQWDTVSNKTVSSKSTKFFSTHEKHATQFGIERDLYDTIIKAYELGQLYGFSSLFSDAAFSVHKKYSISLEKAFSFVDNILDFMKELSESDTDDCNVLSEKDIESFVFEYALDPFACYVFFECNLSVSTADYLLSRIPLSKEDIMKIEPKALRWYAHAGDMDFGFFIRAYHYYFDHADESYYDEDFDNYLDCLSRGVSIEIAFENIIPSGGLGYGAYVDLPDLDDIEDSPFEKLAAEYEAWNNVIIDAD